MCFIFTIMINDRTKEKDSGVVNQKQLTLLNIILLNHFSQFIIMLHNNVNFIQMSTVFEYFLAYKFEMNSND